jgi:hypothetical protein
MKVFRGHVQAFVGVAAEGLKTKSGKIILFVGFLKQVGGDLRLQHPVVGQVPIQ